MIDVLHVRAFEDNYIWLIISDGGNATAVIDPGDAAPVQEALARLGLRLEAILCTHHHGDHVGGVAGLVTGKPVPVYGPAREGIHTVTRPVVEGDTISLAGLGVTLRVLDIPGHTRGHVAYYGAGMLFCGDTLFSAGCGRLFEGTAAQMHHSLQRLADLPGDTRVYCGHEYTESNLRFALAVEPDNAATLGYRNSVIALRRRDRPTLPSTIALEKSVNPFLRCDSTGVRGAAEQFAHKPLPSGADVFATLRRWKDGFNG